MKDLFLQNFDPSPVLEVMETMVMVTFHEFSLVVQTGRTNEQLIPLLQLVSSLQTSLLSWAWGQMTENGDAMKPKGIQMATGCKCKKLSILLIFCFIYHRNQNKPHSKKKKRKVKNWAPLLYKCLASMSGSYYVY